MHHPYNQVWDNLQAIDSNIIFHVSYQLFFIVHCAINSHMNECDEGNTVLQLKFDLSLDQNMCVHTFQEPKHSKEVLTG